MAKKVSETVLKERLKLVLKYKNDPALFIRECISLPEVGGSAEFNLYGKQEELIKSIHDDHYVAVCKTRQTGASTVVQAYLVYLGTFYENIIVGVLSRDNPECTDFARKTMDMIDTMKYEWLKPKYVKKTEQTFILNTGFKLFTSTVNPSKPASTLRGKSLTMLIIDEAAFISYIDEAYTGMAPTFFKSQSKAKEKNIPYGCVIISTPNGMIDTGEWYFNQITKSRNNQSLYKYFQIHWKEISEFADDPLWYKTQCELLGGDKRKIAQELDMIFLGSRNSIFEDNTIDRLQGGIQKPIYIKKFFSGEIWFWEEPNDKKRYLIGVDTATFSGKCHSSVQILDFDGLNQVAEYQGDIEVTDFAEFIKKVMDIFTNCFSIIEVNSYGNQVVETLKRDYNYANRLYIRLVKDKYGKVTEHKYGLETDARTRPLIIDSLITYINLYPNIVKSSRLSYELMSLIDRGGRIKGKNTDDLVLAFAFVLYAYKYNLTRFTEHIYLPNEHIDNMASIMKSEDNNIRQVNFNNINEILNIEDRVEFNKVLQKLKNNINTNNFEKFYNTDNYIDEDEIDENGDYNPLLNLYD